MTDFKEIQRIDRALLVFVAVVSILAVAGPFVMVYNEMAATTPATDRDAVLSDYLLLFSGMLLFTAVVVALIASQRLEIEVNRYRLRFRMPPFVKWREIKPEEIESYRVEKAKWFQKLRKSRLHYNPFTKKWSYMLTRKYFIEMKLKNGKALLLSTTRPDDLKAAMEALMEKEK